MNQIKVSSIVKTSPRKLQIIANAICGRPSLRVQLVMDASKKRACPIIAKAIKNGIHLLKREHNISENDSYIKEAFVGKFKAIRKIRRYAKGRACFGKSYLSRITMILKQKEKNEAV